MANPASVESTTPSDRLSFTVFLAIAVHGLLIFGLAFELSKPSNSAPSVTVTLATHDDEEAPDQADFIAQANQLASGTLDEAKQITTDQLSPFNSQSIEQTQLENQTLKRIESTANPSVITTQEASQQLNQQTLSTETSEKQSGTAEKEVPTLTNEIASLAAKLDRQRQQYAKRPRERVLTSVSAKAAKDAAYLNEWTQKVEHVGNENFPQAAIQQRITGSLRLQSIVKWDGTIIKAEILQSSGHGLLDNAALRIIRQAAPFMPFPPEIRKDTDQLAIIRTWHFKLDGLSTSN